MMTPVGVAQIVVDDDVVDEGVDVEEPCNLVEVGLHGEITVGEGVQLAVGIEVPVDGGVDVVFDDVVVVVVATQVAGGKVVINLEN